MDFARTYRYLVLWQNKTRVLLMKLVSYTLMACTLNEVLRTKISESLPLAPSLGTRTRLRSRRLELVGARKNRARVSPSRATREGFTKFRAILTRKRDCAQLQKFGEREQARPRLNFASKSSKGKFCDQLKISKDHSSPLSLAALHSHTLTAQETKLRP